MASPSKAKGDRAELAFVKHVTPWFPNARRGKAGAEADLGDIFGVRDRDGDDWTVQIADRAVMLREHGAVIRKAAEAAEQSERAGTPLWCLVVKRAGCADVGQWFVWLPTWMLWRTPALPYSPSSVTRRSPGSTGTGGTSPAATRASVSGRRPRSTPELVGGGRRARLEVHPPGRSPRKARVLMAAECAECGHTRASHRSSDGQGCIAAVVVEEAQDQGDDVQPAAHDRCWCPEFVT